MIDPTALRGALSVRARRLPGAGHRGPARGRVGARRGADRFGEDGRGGVRARARDGAGGKCFYTTPLKALSNQKFGDFVARHGAAEVGLLTGDNSINPEAPIVVMTTEVLRNMLYEQSRTLEGLRYVVMDEVHYLQDPYRGAVWEEVLIHLPQSVSVVCLSATISNAEEFGEWVDAARGDPGRDRGAAPGPARAPLPDRASCTRCMSSRTGS